MSRTSIETYETMQLERSAVAKQIGSITPPKACFVVMGGMDVGRVIALDEPVITIGRDAQCAVVLQDDGVSIGVATVPSDASVEVDELISTADVNLYHAKRHGRNQVVTSPVPPMSDKQ
jgi:GGDEF domain-containing protein